MQQIDTNQLLAKIREMSELTQGLHAQNPEPAVHFSDILKQSIENVNELQKVSGELGSEFDAGNQQIGLEEVMIAKQKAKISFQAMLKVKNELVNAYKEIMSMPV